MVSTSKFRIVTLPTATQSLPVAVEQRMLQAFVQFNKDWITRCFKLEASDMHYLSQPKRFIIDAGGYLFIALYNDKPVGCCALIYHAEAQKWELAKMAVSTQAQGHGAGWQWGQMALNKAWQLGADEVFLEANTRLEASVHLYYKLEFEAVDDYTPVYDRCNLYMVCKKTKNIHS